MSSVTHARPAADVRTRILDAAADLFAEQGFDATSVAQVVDRAGVAKGGFYHHFASKQDLLSEIYGELITRQLANMDRILAESLPHAQTLRLLIVDLIETTAASSQQALVFVREGQKVGDQRLAELRRARRRYHDAVARLIADGQRAGEFDQVASAEMVTFTVFGVINALPTWYRPTGRKRPTQIANEVSALILSGLLPREAAR